MAIRMFRVNLCLYLLITWLMAPVPASAQNKPAPDIAGTWQGTLDLGVAKLRLVVDFKKKASGGFMGTMDSPDQGAFGLPIDEVTAKRGRLRSR